MNNYTYKWLKIKIYRLFNQESNKKQPIKYLFWAARQSWLVSGCEAKFPSFPISREFSYANLDLLCSVDLHVQKLCHIFRTQGNQYVLLKWNCAGHLTLDAHASRPVACTTRIAMKEVTWTSKVKVQIGIGQPLFLIVYVQQPVIGSGWEVT